MKDSGTALGGSVLPQYTGICVWRRVSYNRCLVLTSCGSDTQYLMKVLEGFATKGLVPYALSIQNQPLNENYTYPTTTYTAQTEASVAKMMKELLLKKGWIGLKLIGMCLHSFSFQL